MQTLIKNGTIVTEKDFFKSDLLIENEKVKQISPEIQCGQDARVIDADGLLILPGGVDVHVHLDLPMCGTVSSDDHYTGTKAAAFGGTTTVIDFVSQDSDDLHKNIALHREKAEKKAAIDFGLHTNITHLTPEVEKNIPQLIKDGVSSVKVFTAYNNRLRLMDDEILKVLRIAKDNGILTMMHAENGDVIDLLVKEAVASGHLTPEWHAKTRPAWSAVEALLRGCALAGIADAPLYFVHMNTAGEVDQLEYAQKQGLTVLGETCPQYLFFTEDDLLRPDGAKWICSPPVRSRKDQTRLWGGLQQGIINTIATDHCPFFFEGSKPIFYEGQPVSIAGKELGRYDFTKIPNGLPGVGDRLPVMWTKMVASGMFSPSQFVALISSSPAKIFGMYPQKGTIQVNSDADLVLLDPDHCLSYGTEYSQQRTDYNLYEGWELCGYPAQVFSRGELIVDHGNWLGKPGRGKFIHRLPFDKQSLK